MSRVSGGDPGHASGPASKTGQCDVGRLQHNYEVLSGLSSEEAEKRLKEVLEKNDAARKNSPIGNATPPVKPEPPQKPGASGGDGPPDGSSDGKGPSGDSSGDAQKQSSLLPDPDADPETKNFTPEQNNLLKDFGKTDGPLDEILAKDPRDLTEAEFVEIKKAMIDLPAGPAQERLDALATAFHDDKFGIDPVKLDAVGRLIEPEPIRPINKHPVPARTPDGEPLTGAVNKIGKVVAGAGGADGAASAVQSLQTGLNLLKQVLGARLSRARTPGLVADLKTDGDVGTRTRRALRIATSNLGRPKIEEGFALGRFGRFALGVQTGRDDTRKLGATIGKAFEPLFRPPGTALTKQGRVENLAFQATLNDLGPKVFDRDTFQPIKEDGLIGPRTESAFNTVLPAAGPDRFTSRLGHNLGFFDFDDFG